MIKRAQVGVEHLTAKAQAATIGWHRTPHVNSHARHGTDALGLCWRCD
jgi:hypothetical protein